MFENDDLHHWHTEVSDVTPQKPPNKHTPPKPTYTTPKSKISLSDPIDDLTDIAQSPPKSPPGTPKTPQNSATPPYAPSTLQNAPPTPQNTLPNIPQIHQNTADTIAGSSNGINPRTLKKLAQGQIPFTDRLDLHGFYETAAWAATNDFINECHSQEHRCVLIIHGKGKGYGDKSDMGIIKAQMAQWLTHNPKVLAFHTAHKKDGGRGAIYVYLKRQR